MKFFAIVLAALSSVGFTSAYAEVAAGPEVVTGAEVVKALSQQVADLAEVGAKGRLVDSKARCNVLVAKVAGVEQYVVSILSPVKKPVASLLIQTNSKYRVAKTNNEFESFAYYLPLSVSAPRVTVVTTREPSVTISVMTEDSNETSCVFY